MRGLFLAAVAVSLVACPAPQPADAGTGGGGGLFGGGGGSTGGGGGGGAATLDEVQFCLDAMSAAIDLRVRCNEVTDAGIAPWRAQSDAACRAYGLSTLGILGTSRVDMAKGTQCLTKLRAETCATSTVFLGTLPFDCQAALSGAVPLDGGCYFDECETGGACDLTTTCPGTCRPRVAIGQMPMNGEQCVEGAEPYDGVCTALVAAGQSCAPTGGSFQQHGCTPPAQCLGQQTCTSPQTRLATAGQPCDFQTGTLCAFGFDCISGTCAALAPLNGSCAQANCQIGLFCNGTQTCVAQGAMGASCVGDGTCLAGLSCLSSVCAPLPELGQPCPQGRCANYHLFCASDGTCKARGGIGATCTQLNDCLPNHYCTQAGTCARRKNNGETCAMTPAGSSTDECLGSSCTQGTCEGQLICAQP